MHHDPPISVHRYWTLVVVLDYGRGEEDCVGDSHCPDLDPGPYRLRGFVRENLYHSHNLSHRDDAMLENHEHSTHELETEIENDGDTDQAAILQPHYNHYDHVIHLVLHPNFVHS